MRATVLAAWRPDPDHKEAQRPKPTAAHEALKAHRQFLHTENQGVLSVVELAGGVKAADPSFGRPL